MSRRAHSNSVKPASVGRPVPTAQSHINPCCHIHTLPIANTARYGATINTVAAMNNQIAFARAVMTNVLLPKKQVRNVPSGGPDSLSIGAAKPQEILLRAK